MSSPDPNTNSWEPRVRSSEPMFNVPSVVVATIVALVVVQLGRQFLLSADDDIEFLLWFAFIPARYVPELASILAVPGGLGADIFTFVSYSLIHGNGLH